jgi:RNA polymerase sigma-70 factor (ECF subfamily)
LPALPTTASVAATGWTSVTDEHSIPATARAQALDFEAIYAQHFDYVYRVVVRLAGRSHAEDLAQDVWAIVHRRLAQFEGRAQLTTWLFQIAYHVVGNHIRREQVRRGFLALVGRSDEVQEPIAARALEHAEDAARLTRAVAALAWKQRAVLVLHEVEGWPCEIIAERLGVPVATVHTRLHHARKRLAAQLGGSR